jgi:hypothetical protein
MPELVLVPAHPAWGLRRLCRSDQRSDQPLEARVKRECSDLYPGIDPRVWYQVVLNGEYKDDLEGFWIQVEEWVTYVLAKHFDLQTRPVVH